MAEEPKANKRFHPGVDLNRNWEPKWRSQVPRELAKDLADRSSSQFAGEQPFSERETQAIRDFLVQHAEVRIFVDYHSGFAPFLQGGVGFPIPPSEADLAPVRRRRLEQLSTSVATAVSNANDDRHGFVVNKERDVAKTIRSIAPWWAKVFIPRSIPSAPGTSGEWVYGELGIAAIGVEIMRDWGYFRGLPGSKEKLIESQAEGLVLLLGQLNLDPFEESR